MSDVVSSKESTTRKVTEYLELREIGLKPATKVYGIFSVRHGDKLGEIKWYGPWRQFAFFPTLETIWNEQCLLDVVHFIHVAKVEGRLKR